MARVICATATPPVILRHVNHACLDWVHVYVADHGQQILVVLYALALVSVLKEMPDTAVLLVVPCGITCPNPLHYHRNTIVRFLNQEVHMVNHQAIA